MACLDLPAPARAVVLGVLLCVALGRAGPAGAEAPGGVMSMADENRDGELTIEEWNAHSDSLFNEIDRSQDGAVTAEELRESFEVLDQDDNGVLDVREAPLVIEQADRDGDGLVTEDEYELIDWESYRGDANRDGRVSADEFRRGRDEGFRRFDGDRDDRIRPSAIDSAPGFSILRF